MGNYIVTVTWQKPNGEKVTACTVEAANSPSEAMEKVNKTSHRVLLLRVPRKNMKDHIVRYNLTRGFSSNCCDACIHKRSMSIKKTREKIVFCQLDTFEHLDINRVSECNQRTTYNQSKLANE